MKNKSYQQSCLAMAVFGCTALLLGLVTILYPDYMIDILGLSKDDTAGLRSAIALNGIASTNMGAYYLYMVYHKVVPFFKVTVIFRLMVTVPVILYWYFVNGQDSFLSIAAWEGLGALWVFGALRYDESRLGAVE